MRMVGTWAAALAALAVTTTAALGAGCGDGTPAATADAQPTASADGAPPSDAALDAAPDAAVPLAFTGGPTFTLAPNPSAPLSGLLEVSTNRPTRLSIAIADPDRAFTVELDELASDHQAPILGLRADTTHTVTVTATDAGGAQIVAAPVDAVTGPLPATLPHFTVGSLDHARMEPGVTLVSLGDFLMIVDDEGEPVWLYEPARAPHDARRMRNGHLLMTTDHTLVVEVDMLGNVIHSWAPADRESPLPDSTAVAVDSFHHEILDLPDGNLLTLSSELRTFDGYPTSELDPTPRAAPQNVIGDEVVVFEPGGEVVTSWSLFDRIDPYRVGYGSFGGFWSDYYAAQGGGLDWSHANAVVPDPSDGGTLVSVRHQDAVIKLDAGGNLVWILGNHDNWGPAYRPYLLTPVGEPFAWQYHQHAPEIEADGHILLFDNGNFRVSPPAPIPPDSYSRAVEFAVDPARMEVRQVWEYDAGRTLYSSAVGDVDALPATGNVLVTFGQIGRVQEVTRDDPAVVVFDLDAVEAIYRSERLPSLYP